MSALSTVREGRAAAERELLNSVCTVTRPGVLSGPIDPGTGLETAGTPTVVSTGLACHVQGFGSQATTTVGGDVIITQQPTICLSLSAPELRIGDRIHITASPNPLNVDQIGTVDQLPGGDLAVLARYRVELITG